MDPAMRIPPYPGWQLPFTLGHEVAGWVETAGAQASAGFSHGEPVILVATESDGTCPYCQAGLDNNCEVSGAGRGYGRDGGLAPFMLVRNARPLIALKTLDPQRPARWRMPGRPPCTPCAASWRARPGSTAVVIGAGGLGSFAVQFLRATHACARDRRGREPRTPGLRQEPGCTRGRPRGAPSTAADLKSLTGERAPRWCSTSSASMRRSRLALPACAAPGRSGSSAQAWARCRTPGSTCSPAMARFSALPAAASRTWRRSLTLAEQGLLRNDTERFAFSQVPRAYEKLDQGQLLGRAVVIPDA